ncbi:hypothetical protein BFP70_02870 [Thioclava sp. SK-1]|uniref:hypothetical protein n=1 Tax=Thioclava sp. SK-1 TaxID=1889770 RepID=UPI000824A052|nr:hypothetical protein [Thioclava sp. SK-1]OCX67121.1 hypothetical protein BFP70_02870 [Thioclava sp. SK-1]
MLIFWDQRLVFLATPKSGSTAIQAALEPLASLAADRPEPIKHMTAVQYRTHLAPFLTDASGEKFTTVALMREPIDWLRSWYRFRVRDEFDETGTDLNGHSFEHFAQDYMAVSPPDYADLGNQSKYLTDTAGNRCVDRIFPYEDMAAFIMFLEDQLQFEINLPRLNVPPVADTQLSAATHQNLQQHMARDIQLYNSLL